jgi:hypothetical protein
VLAGLALRPRQKRLSFLPVIVAVARLISEGRVLCRKDPAPILLLSVTPPTPRDLQGVESRIWVAVNSLGETNFVQIAAEGPALSRRTKSTLQRACLLPRGAGIRAGSPR